MKLWVPWGRLQPVDSEDQSDKFHGLSFLQLARLDILTPDKFIVDGYGHILRRLCLFQLNQFRNGQTVLSLFFGSGNCDCDNVLLFCALDNLFVNYGNGVLQHPHPAGV